MPVSFCDVTSSTAPVATAASIALPPRRRISSPASAASGSLVATMPWRARTSDRPCDNHPCARDPGTAVIAVPGCGWSADGTPNAWGDCADDVVSVADATTSTAAMMAATRFIESSGPAEAGHHVREVRLQAAPHVRGVRLQADPSYVASAFRLTLRTWR